MEWTGNKGVFMPMPWIQTGHSADAISGEPQTINQWHGIGPLSSLSLGPMQQSLSCLSQSPARTACYTAVQLFQSTFIQSTISTECQIITPPRASRLFLKMLCTWQTASMVQATLRYFPRERPGSFGTVAHGEEIVVVHVADSINGASNIPVLPQGTSRVLRRNSDVGEKCKKQGRSLRPGQTKWVKQMSDVRKPASCKCS
jgi:hypothetical protein